MKKFGVLFSLLLIMPDAFAGNTEQASNLDKWGQNAYWKYCQSHDVNSDKPCIGASKNNCTSKSFVNPQYNDEYGVLMMVAVNTTEGGAYFCPVSVIAKNKNKDHSWTRYFKAGDNCVWLCRKGRSGEKCELSDTEEGSCDTSLLRQSDYDSVVAVGDSADAIDVENDVAMWGANSFANCYDWPEKNTTKSKAFVKGEEHDLILAISDWLPSGHGAWVKPYMVRAERQGWEDMKSWINIYPASSTQNNTSSQTTAMLACKNGYKVNSTNTDCVPINRDACSDVRLCPDWFEANLNTDIHVQSTVGSCIQWRCKENAYALSKVGGSQCVPCGPSQRNGINPENGTCVSCPQGSVFSKTAANTGYCADAYVLDKVALQYGSAGAGTEIQKQCWIKANVTDYKDCVLANAKISGVVNKMFNNVSTNAIKAGNSGANLPDLSINAGIKNGNIGSVKTQFLK